MNRRQFLVGVGATAGALIVPAVSATAGSNDDISPANVSSYCPNAYEWALLREVNEWRTYNGVPKLRMSRDLSAAAHHHAYYMSITDDVDHTLDGYTWSENIYGFRYPDAFLGEDVAAGRQSAAGIVQLWIRSPEHNAVMLDPKYIRMGGGRVYNPNGYYKYYWVADFGSVSHRTIISC